ncbi:MAG: hypothetical protein IKP28_00590 [Clostridia bacterium]|nr:hypothetical protein [Clostridia bacterium]
MDKSKKTLIAAVVILSILVIGLAVGLIYVLYGNEITNGINSLLGSTFIDETTTNEISENETTNETTTKNTNKVANNTSKTNQTSNKAENNKKTTAYVEKNNIKVLSATDNYTNPVYCYTTNREETKDLVDVGVSFEKTSASYKFYDYSVSKADKDGNVTVSFKYDMTVPIKYTRTDYSNKINYYYNVMQSSPVLFDYYTGEEYLLNEYSASASEDTKKMKYNEIKWENKTYKIGVRADTVIKWNGKETVSENVYADTKNTTITYYISVPQSYDGLMVAIQKNGVTKQDFEDTRNYNKKYNDLKEQAEKTGEKSKELIEWEKKANTMIKLFESRIENKKYTKDDFYVFKVKDIKPAK